MRKISKFPKQFKLIDKRVKEVVIKHALSREDYSLEDLAFMQENGIAEEYRSCEWWAVLKNRKTFGFWIVTPEFARDYIDKVLPQYEERTQALVSSGLILVNEVSLEAILEALEGCLESSEGIQQFGYRMSGGKRKRKKTKK